MEKHLIISKGYYLPLYSKILGATNHVYIDEYSGDTKLLGDIDSGMLEIYMYHDGMVNITDYVKSQLEFGDRVEISLVVVNELNDVVQQNRIREIYKTHICTTKDKHWLDTEMTTKVGNSHIQFRKDTQYGFDTMFKSTFDRLVHEYVETFTDNSQIPIYVEIVINDDK